MTKANRERSPRSEELAFRKLGLIYDCCDALGSNTDRMGWPLPSVQCGGAEQQFDFSRFEAKFDIIEYTAWWDLKQNK